MSLLKTRWPKAIEETEHLPRIPLDDEIAALSAQVLYTPALRKEYNDMYYAAKINPAQLELVKRRAQVIHANIKRYEEVSRAVKVPLILVAVIHQMECGGRFNAHLHNGDPLTARTTHVPKGRPKDGQPPFKWEVSAIDALRGMGFATVQTWDIPRMLYCLEAYNGFGYRLYHPEVKSPYLWSFTNMYRKGKYVEDGKYSPTAISRQIGCVALMKAYGNKQTLIKSSL